MARIKHPYITVYPKKDIKLKNTMTQEECEAKCAEMQKWFDDNFGKGAFYCELNCASLCRKD